MTPQEKVKSDTVLQMVWGWCYACSSTLQFTPFSGLDLGETTRRHNSQARRPPLLTRFVYVKLTKKERVGLMTSQSARKIMSCKCMIESIIKHTRKK